MNPEPKRAGWAFLAAWVAATSLGIGLAAWMASTFFAGHGITALFFLMGIGPALGVFQWLVLRPRIQGASWWVPASALGWPAGFLGAGLLPGDFVPFAIVGGGASALLQLFVLHRYVSWAGRVGWVVLASVAWGLGFAFWEALASVLWKPPYPLLDLPRVAKGLLDSTPGILAGIPTGGALLWLLRRSLAQEPPGRILTS